MGETTGPAPAVIYLGDRPDQARAAYFDPTAQALAATGLVVFAPTLPGSPGYSRKVTNALKDQLGPKPRLEISLYSRRHQKIRRHRLRPDRGRRKRSWRHAWATTGGEPAGQVQAVVAIDPIADWDLEFDFADADFRAWMTKNFGIPATNRGTYALRTPSTFVGVIDAALLIIGTDRAPAGRAAQLDELTADMRELEVISSTRFAQRNRVGYRDQSRRLHSPDADRGRSPIDARREQVLDAATV